METKHSKMGLTHTMQESRILLQKTKAWNKHTLRACGPEDKRRKKKVMIEKVEDKLLVIFAIAA